MTTGESAAADGPPILPAAPVEPQPAPFRFHGRANEYFRIWIVNLLLTLPTAGMFLAWAKVRKRRYLRGSTQLLGHRFDYRANPLRILARPCAGRCAVCRLQRVRGRVSRGAIRCDCGRLRSIALGGGAIADLQRAQHGLSRPAVSFPPVAGDFATLTSLAATVPLTVLTQGYARDFEREADRFAHDLLHAQGIERRCFSAILLKLDTARAELARTSTYLSTHPTTEERQRLFGVLAADERAAILTEGTAQPIALHQVSPPYRFNARLKKLQGEVIVDFVVDVQGNVQRASAIRSSHVELEHAATLAVRQWKFQPGRKNFRAVDIHMQVPIHFTLSEEPAEAQR